MLSGNQPAGAERKGKYGEEESRGPDTAEEGRLGVGLGGWTRAPSALDGFPVEIPAELAQLSLPAGQLE